MKLSALTKKLEYESVVHVPEDRDVLNGYTSDLLSDVMGNAEEGSVLITIQAHRNSVAVASQLDFPAIIICNNRQIPSDMEDSARKEGIALLKTKDNQFTASYKVFTAIHS
jgi:hypothetical protein